MGGANACRTGRALHAVSYVHRVVDRLSAEHPPIGKQISLQSRHHGGFLCRCHGCWNNPRRDIDQHGVFIHGSNPNDRWCRWTVLDAGDRDSSYVYLRSDAGSNHLLGRCAGCVARGDDRRNDALYGNIATAHNHASPGDYVQLKISSADTENGVYIQVRDLQRFMAPCNCRSVYPDSKEEYQVDFHYDSIATCKREGSWCVWNMKVY